MSGTSFGVLRQEAIDQEGYAIATTIIIWILTALMVSITITQTIFVFQDFCTIKRKSVGYGKTKPEITDQYKFINYSSLISLYLNLLPLLGSVAISFSKTDAECNTRWSFILTTQQVAKVITYMILLSRLHRLYKHSAFAYPLQCLYFFGVLAVIYGIGAIIAINRFPNTSRVEHGQNYPSWCVPVENLFFVAGGIIIVQDITVTIGFYWAFSIPLGKLIQHLEKQGDDTKKDLISNIVYYGSKINVLTGTMLVGTLLFTTLAIITGLGVFGAFDVVIVPICLTLMTPYYPDDRYYQNFCCICYSFVSRGREYTGLAAFKELLISGMGPDVELNFKYHQDVNLEQIDPVTEPTET